MKTKAIKRLRCAEGITLMDIDTGRKFKVIKKDNNTITLNNGDRMTVRKARQIFERVIR